MTLSEAIALAEKQFIVHREVGQSVPWLDQNGKEMGNPTRDASVAPCGDPYVVLTSFGVNVVLPEGALALFNRERPAATWWYEEVLDYAASVEADKDKWAALHLYWKREPEFLSTTYLAMDQGGLQRTASPLASVLTIDLGFVYSEMLISKLDPDGKEG